MGDRTHNMGRNRFIYIISVKMTHSQYERPIIKTRKIIDLLVNV